MKKQNFLIIGIVLAIAIVIGITSTGFLTLNQDREEIKIGYVSALSGDAGIWGQSLKKGFDFAIQEINEEGGIDGKLIKPVYENDECDAKKGIDAFNKIIKLDRIKIVTGTVCSSVAMSVAPITQENKILYLNTLFSKRLCLTTSKIRRKLPLPRLLCLGGSVKLNAAGTAINATKI